MPDSPWNGEFPREDAGRLERGDVIGRPDDLPGLDEPWKLAEVGLPGPSGSFCMYLIPYGARRLVRTVPMEITDIEVFDDRDAALDWIRYCIARDMFTVPPESRPGVRTVQRMYQRGVLVGAGVIESGHADGRFLVTGIIHGRPFAELAAHAHQATDHLTALLYGDDV